MNFQKVLKKYRHESLTQQEKGSRFERLMANFLKTYQVYDQKFKKTWLWSDWPARDGQDTGIDLVAVTEEEEYWAVQCKCHQADAEVDLSALGNFMTASGQKFTASDGRKIAFSQRLWISTSNNWSARAEEKIRNQSIPFSRISLNDLENAEVDWEKLDKGDFGHKARKAPKTLLPHQEEALAAFIKHFKASDRGQLIMACGTGKTFTSLKIAEALTKGQGLALFLAPSIALIGQTLKEWTAEAEKTLWPVCVCSDPTVSKSNRKSDLDEDTYGVENLSLPASTDIRTIVKQLKHGAERHPDRLRVIFSTYQSISATAEAIKAAKVPVNLIVADEAHRTTGVTLSDEDESEFVKVHDSSFIKAEKRLYMTATPRIYKDEVRTRAEEYSATLCSMDDESLFGPVVYRLGFGTAVDHGLLSDYKCLVFTVSRNEVSEEIQIQAAAGKKEIDADDVTKLIGCLNALSKNMDIDGQILKQADPEPMRKAVAFCQTIAKSNRISEVMNRLTAYYSRKIDQSRNNPVVNLTANHIDGSMGASIRDGKMAWLKEVPEDSKECRVLTNVRCLSEGVDVPTLDAVMFLAVKNSEIEVVQSVGRVMRKAPGKKYGYIIIPVVVPAYVDPGDALNDNKPYQTVWKVLNALKAHDDRFVATINKIRFNEKAPAGGGSILIGGMPRSEGELGEDVSCRGTTGDVLAGLRENDSALHKAIYARLVKKMNSDRDLLLWAKDVAKIAEGFKDRITKVVAKEGPHKEEFDKFLTGLRKTLNPSVDSGEAAEMLAQHLITKPVFEALFENYSFVRNNPVSRSLEAMIDVLEDQGLEKDRIILTRFYETVKNQVAQITSSEGRQKIILNLYDGFFKAAMPKAVEKLGIVYTPVEVVDFIINSVAAVLKKEFKRDISDENVHILDPFAGTGTFITRLIHSGLLGKSLNRKYKKEIHANEIILLAYYIASINIENAYHEAAGSQASYLPFDGICLADTFQLYKSGESDLLKDLRLKQNTKRVEAQKKAHITVIFGNPPYSVGQGDANKNAKNQPYPELDYDIASSYAARSQANNKNSLYDSYIKAFYWASKRLASNDCGVIAYVSNSGWLDGNAMDGMRKCLAEEFSKIYVFDLRGNCRTSGELRRKEAGNVFGLGSRTPIAITVLVKNSRHRGPAEIFYHDIGDYLSKEKKLGIVAERRDVLDSSVVWEKIVPNDMGDWLNQRSVLFSELIAIGDKHDKNNKNTFFCDFYSNGLKTQRDVWCYNSSKAVLTQNIKNTTDYYNNLIINVNNQLNKDVTDDIIYYDIKKISLSDGLIKNLTANNMSLFKPNKILSALYRPFFKQFIYYDKILNERTYKIPSIFPTRNHHNLVICVSGIGGTKENSALISNVIPDLNCLDAGTQCFPRYYYEEDTSKSPDMFPSDDIIDGYIRHDGITNFIFSECRTKYGPNKITKDDIFYYVYGLLHSPDYREIFSADLKKSLPRLPLVDRAEDFRAFSKAGRVLADLHLNYETVKPYSKVTISGEEKENFKVDKIRFIRKYDKTAIQFNSSIRITGIPLEAYDYVINGRSAVEWILDRYQVEVDSKSGIKNDPNDWAKEHNQPRYILDLILRVITVSLDTMKIVDSLPKLTF
ncbi:MAG: DEAD/DEAH box helicase family protein [Deltaproteobacteria bacterium]|jgi:predicted helicase|nr:DEAD/DEAH box helicase family protein [Deltaproteobacteria bacterium]